MLTSCMVPFSAVESTLQFISHLLDGLEMLSMQFLLFAMSFLVLLRFVLMEVKSIRRVASELFGWLGNVDVDEKPTRKRKL
jgi:hypothetical protein